MTIRLDRRQLLQSGLFGLGAMASPGAAQLLAARGFTHQVASGEPSADSVLLWTRFVGEGETTLGAEIAEDAEFGRIVGRAETLARPDHDFTAKVVIDGLDPNRWYYYRFRGPDGASSAVGRTRTLPVGPTGRFNLGVVSCSNLRFGYFNAYAHAAARNDLDLIVHLGDYFYEYGVDTYPGPRRALEGRIIRPETETIALADYWLRYASYRADPDLAALHRNFPMIARWDDHEIANNPWFGGAENHQPDEGEWEVRKRAAIQAYRDWMPVHDEMWASYQIGDLATIFMPETRIVARSRQFEYTDIVRGDRPAAEILQDFRDGEWNDASRTILGAEQEAWLAGGMRESVASGTRWQVLAQQVVVGKTYFPLPLADRIMESDSEQVREQAALRAAATRVGLPLNLDAWDGYPAAQARLLSSAQEADADMVVLAGDTHNAWAYDLAHEGRPAGIEFATHSVTSPGFEGSVPFIPPDRLARSLIDASPELRWADTSARGYMTVTLTPDEARSEWLFLDTIRDRSTRIARRHSMAAARGARRLAA